MEKTVSGVDGGAERLFGALRGFERVAVGYSGGVDSALLLAAAVRAVGAENTLAIIADSPSMPHGELADALTLAKSLGAECVVVRPGEIDDPEYAANPPDRCYICKRIIFKAIATAAAERGFGVVLDGENADDAHDNRPGRRAVKEAGVRSPLAEAGFTKSEIRELSARWGLPTAQKPALACLATRVPFGTKITAEILERIGRAEAALRVAGFGHCRVRHHVDVARIEVPAERIAEIAAAGMRERVAEAVMAAGYKFVAVDLSGYKMGGLN
ncbi:MAG: ATP-dependent sacrificial sulfur transferase LarE [Kiritimatiellaeota bacterium]|nr:ATP-dependent sacrificial sulfur transferase LarE [Kiritimatiellota bacterium]